MCANINAEEIMNEQNRANVDFLMEKAREVFLSDGYHEPMVFIFIGKDVSITGFGASQFGSVEKGAAADLIRKALHDGADMMVLISESWIVQSVTEEDAEDVKRYLVEHQTLEGHRCTKEFLTVSCNDGVSSVLYCAEVLRTGEQDKHPALGEWSLLSSSDNDKVGGRFAVNTVRTDKYIFN